MFFSPTKDIYLRHLENVRGRDNGFPVCLIRDGETGRLVIRGLNEGSFVCVDFDLLDLVEWLSGVCTHAINREEIAYSLTTTKYLE